MRAGYCKHFEGFGRGACAQGVIFRAKVPKHEAGRIYRFPCIAKLHTKCGEKGLAPVACTLREEPTPAEVTAFEISMRNEASYLFVAPWRQRMQNKYPEGVELAQESCPLCNNIVSLGISARTRLMHAQCELPECLSFTE